MNRQMMEESNAKHTAYMSCAHFPNLLLGAYSVVSECRGRRLRNRSRNGSGLKGSGLIGGEHAVTLVLGLGGTKGIASTGGTGGVEAKARQQDGERNVVLHNILARLMMVGISNIGTS